jgi:voltage-gated potassium channel
MAPENRLSMMIEGPRSRFLGAPVSVRHYARVIVFATAGVVIVGGVMIRALDHREYSSIWEGMWWALQTVTTVGYGDVTPKSTAGRLVGSAVMLEGVAFLAIITASITSSFVARAQALRHIEDAGDQDRAEQRLEGEMRDLSERLARVERLLTELNEKLPDA